MDFHGSDDFAVNINRNIKKKFKKGSLKRDG
jgi:hypothetical protein